MTARPWISGRDYTGLGLSGKEKPEKVPTGTSQTTKWGRLAAQPPSFRPAVSGHRAPGNFLTKCICAAHAGVSTN
jgi:hypothetical protein